MGCCVLNNQNGPIIIAPDRTTTTLENEIKEIEKDNKERKDSKEKKSRNKSGIQPIKRTRNSIISKSRNN